MDQDDSPWSPADATDIIRDIARHPMLSLAYKVHATKRLAERMIFVSDLLYLLKHGVVTEAAVSATRPDYYKYVVTCLTPNSEGREIAAVVIPDIKTLTIKIVTVYWVDEVARRAGTLTE